MIARALLLQLLLRTASLCGAFERPGGAGNLLPVKVHHGSFLDQAGRTRHFRGVNVVYKDPPWLPNVKYFHSNLSFVRDDVELLASLGVNLIRLGVMWPGVVPRARGEVDYTYLRKVEHIVRMAANYGIYTIVEPHQDELNGRFCGEGAPDWWADEFVQVRDFPIPLAKQSYNTSKPTHAQCFSQVSFDYLWTYDLARAYQVLWEKGAPDFGAYWAAVASFFQSEPAVIGGELWNEPFPGDVYAGSGQWRDNKRADAQNLLPFYTEVTRAIRKAVPSPESFAIAYEPTWPVGTQDIHPKDELTPTSGFPHLPEDNGIYAFHYYTPPCSSNFTAYLAARLADARRLHAAPYMSELNLAVWDGPSEAAMSKTLAELEANFVSYTGWQYKSYSGSLPTGTCTGCGNSFFSDDGSLNAGMARAMARPFAGAVAGRTQSASWDAEKLVFSLEYVCVDTGGKPTEIVVPGLGLPPRRGLHVAVEGDSAAEVLQQWHPGRQVPQGPEIVGFTVVHVTHGDIAAVGRRVRVTVSTVPLGPATADARPLFA